MIWNFGFVLIEEYGMEYENTFTRILAFSDYDEKELSIRCSELNDAYAEDCENYTNNKSLIEEYSKKYEEYYVCNSVDYNNPTFSNEKLQIWLKDNPIPKQIEKFIIKDSNDGLLDFCDDPSTYNFHYSVKKISDLC